MIRQTFDGLNPATDFAQIESRKQNKKLSIFLTRDNGVKYVVCDSEVAKSIAGKFIASYGEDVVIKPFIAPKPIVKEEVVEEKVEEVVIPEATNETIVEEVSPIVTETVKEEKVEGESTPTEKPKRTRKKKE